MAKGIGRLAALGIGKETTRGTAVAPSNFINWMEITNPDDQVKTVVDNAAIARLEASDGYAVTMKYGNVGWKTKLTDTHTGLLLLSLCGTDTPALHSGESIVYDHVYTIQQGSQHQSLTLAYKDLNVSTRFANAVVGSFKLDAKINQYIMYEVQTMSKASASASNTVAVTAENEFVPQNITFKNASAQSGLSAATAVKIRSFNLEISCPLELEEVLGADTPNDVLNTPFSVKGSVTLIHDATTFSALQLAGTYQAFRFDMVHAATIGSAANPQLRVDLHRCSITNYKKTLTLDNIIEESFDIQGHYSITDSKLTTITLTNLTASY